MYMGSTGMWRTPNGELYRLGEYETPYEHTRTWKFLPALGMGGTDQEQRFTTRQDAEEHAAARGWCKRHGA